MELTYYICMKDLKEFLFGNLYRSDCHANLFGRNTMAKYPPINVETSIAMINNDIEYKDESLFKYFETYCKDHLKGAVAANGKDIDEIKKVIEISHQQFVCIGEIKGHKHYINQQKEEKQYDNAELAAQACELNLPVFLHWDLDGACDDVLETIIKNTTSKIVLCHCGMNDIDDKEAAFKKAVELQHKYSNLWIEISWVAYSYIERDNRKLSQIDTDRLLLGTDLTNFDSKEDIDLTIANFDYWSKQLNQKRNIKNLLYFAYK